VDGEVILAEFDHPDAAKTILAQVAAAQEITETRRSISKADSARVLGRAGYSDELIWEIHDQLDDPIDVDSAARTLSNYGIGREHLIEMMRGGP
jgi:hypothetical protein